MLGTPAFSSAEIAVRSATPVACPPPRRMHGENVNELGCAGVKEFEYSVLRPDEVSMLCLFLLHPAASAIPPYHVRHTGIARHSKETHVYPCSRVVPHRDPRTLKALSALWWLLDPLRLSTCRVILAPCAKDSNTCCSISVDIVPIISLRTIRDPGLGGGKRASIIRLEKIWT